MHFAVQQKLKQHCKSTILKIFLIFLKMRMAIVKKGYKDW